MTTITPSNSSSVICHQSSVSDFITLLKPRVMTLVVFTGFAGMVLAEQGGFGHINLFRKFIAIFCIALASGAGGAINMWYDRDIDAIMKRTRNRPIPAGLIAPDDALAFGLFLSAFAVMLSGLAVNWTASFLLAFAIFFYTVIYTALLKRRTPQNIVIGGAAGAFPPMIGWAAVTGDIGIESILLFLIIFLWTPPHFWALALYKNDDYAKANIPMMPVVAGAKSTKLQMLFYGYLLALCSLALPALAMLGTVYTISAVALNGVFLYHLHRTLNDDSFNRARKTFGFSILYLFALFSFMMLDRIIY